MDTQINAYLLTTTWGDTYTGYGKTPKEAMLHLIVVVEELRMRDIHSCVQLDIPVVHSTIQLLGEAPF